MRFTFLADPELRNTNYRAYQPAMQLGGRHRHSVVVLPFGHHNINLAKLGENDAVLIHRAVDADTLQLMTQLADAGVGVVWDNDDDMAAVHRSNPNFRKIGGAAYNARASMATRKAVRSAHVVTTPSATLATQFRDHGAADVRVLENFIPLEFKSSGRDKHVGVTIAWLAGYEHQVDNQELRVQETLQRLLDAHPDLRVMSIGIRLNLPSDRYERHPRVEFLDLGHYLARADIGIAPLVDIPWNRARSNIKLKEYASVGLPWLASPIGPYAGLGEQHGGRLVEDDSWFEALDELIRDRRTRKKLARRAARWARRETVDRHAHLWEQALMDAARHAKT